MNAESSIGVVQEVEKIGQKSTKLLGQCPKNEECNGEVPWWRGEVPSSVMVEYKIKCLVILISSGLIFCKSKVKPRIFVGGVVGVEIISFLRDKKENDEGICVVG